MADGRPSVTAQRVAAYRMTFQRLETPYGRPEADEALAQDVAGGTAADLSDVMARYLRGRTAFFDRVVVNALGRQVTQVVNLGAGYDGRAWRYAHDGVQWWEIDQAVTQADKRARLDRLGISGDSVIFVGHDLRQGGLATRLVGAGFEPEAPSLFVCEGVATYVDASSLENALSELRTVATVGTRLALSFRTTSSSRSHGAHRARLEEAVAAWGEPARSSMTAEQADPLLAASRWRSTEISERSRHAGFVMAAPLWSPPQSSGRPTDSRVGAFMEHMLHRAGAETLPAHIESAYGMPVVRARELDLGVFQVVRADGTRWIARVFPASRSTEAAHLDARVLDWLAGHGVPAERCAHERPVSVHAGQPVLVTQFVPGRQAAATPAVFEDLGRILGRLQLLPPGSAGRAAGAWHHLVLDAGPAEELAVARGLLDAAGRRVALTDRTSFETLSNDLDRLDTFDSLPRAFGHPDLVPRNEIRATNGSVVIIDWTGAGWAPRILPLGCLLWAAAGSASRVRANPLCVKGSFE
jgi:methyltransferase (TIGR00027 family)